MDHIYLQNMEFECHIGAGDGERADLQTIEMDVEMTLDLRPAGEGDDLEKTADYGAVFQLCRHVAEDHTYHLLEGLAEHVAHEILKKQPLVQEVAVTVRKPGVPIEGALDYAGVKVERSRT
jgi:7,8-dihydroneopterin aldolase/epimerase/oxygenase